MGKKGKKSGKKGGKKGKKRSPDDPPTMDEIILKKVLKYYEQYSAELNVKCCPDVVKLIKECLEDEKELTKVIVRPIDKDKRIEDKLNAAIAAARQENDLAKIKDLRLSYSNTPPPVLLGPLMKAFNQVQFNRCKELYIVDLPMNYDDTVELSNFVKLSSNPLKKLEIIDCLLQHDSMRKFSMCLSLSRHLSSLSLDYNEIGDKGCSLLCNGLIGNDVLITLSLNYCKLTSKSGEYLGDIISTTAIADIFLDGNDLGCEGALNLIWKISEECETEFMRKEQEEREKLEQEASEKEAASRVSDRGELTEAENTDKENATEQKKGDEKKKKKKKKKKKVKELPPGPWIRKLHLEDNGIDIYENGANQLKSIELLHKTIEAFLKVIKYSKYIEELDLDNNTIGNMSSKMIVQALEFRKFNKVGSLAVRVDEKIDKDIFNAILKGSKKLKKKKGKKKKK